MLWFGTPASLYFLTTVASWMFFVGSGEPPAVSRSRMGVRMRAGSVGEGLLTRSTDVLTPGCYNDILSKEMR